MPVPLKVLYVTSQLPNPKNHHHESFITREISFLRQAGVDLDVFHYRGGLNPIAYSKAIRQFHRCLHQKKFDLIHGRFGQTLLVILTQRSLPSVVTFGGTDVLGRRTCTGKLTLFGRLQRLISTVGVSHIDEAVVVSENLARTLKRPDVHVLPSGIDLEMTKPIEKNQARQTLGWDQQTYHILFIANPDKPLKRFWLAQNVVESAHRSFPGQSLELTVVQGEPPQRIPIYMSAADVLLLTSVHEGSPNVIKEALACNLPIVSVDVGDVRERIENIDGCVLCHRDDESTITNALVSVLKQRIRIRGRQSITHLNNRFIAEQMLAIYEKAIQGKKSSEF